MNNDEYNAKQKKEANKNLTPYSLPKREKKMPEAADVPGVIHLPPKRRKKTENKW